MTAMVMTACTGQKAEKVEATQDIAISEDQQTDPRHN